MSKKTIKSFSTTHSIWEMAREKSVRVFGYENRSAYINQLIKQDKPNRYEI